MLGDFNATLDQAELRDVVGRGYRDAADVAGKGLEPTFPRQGWHDLGPFITIDHVLADERLGIVDYCGHRTARQRPPRDRSGAGTALIAQLEALSSVCLTTPIPFSIISPVGAAAASGSRSAVQTKRLRSSSSAKTCAAPLWWV